MKKQIITIGSHFSGIQSYKYAFERLGIPFESTFACDFTNANDQGQ